ncbi:MAG: M23 family metallopeptidase [Spirochaetaceae bacterium]|jgi:murein DD-endopeptidase MepM/ murein hydrolase activator NlpD|nr:M23 family metallopeptidase [Spirochaetaceae bacterium]
MVFKRIRAIVLYAPLLLCVWSVSAQNVKLAVMPETPRLGEAFSVGIKITGAYQAQLRAVLVNAAGQRLNSAPCFTVEPALAMQAAILSVPSTAQAGTARIQIESGATLLAERPITILDRLFASEEISLDARNTALRTEADPQKTRESNLLWAILTHTGAELYTSDAFILPVSPPRRTSFFGDRRIFRYSNGASDRSIHAGIDYGVPTGTPVRACAAGRVVLASFRIVTGNSVVIEHLPGVYSLYYHLSTLNVASGDILSAGDCIGESGATGLATGPHLHWEIRVATENSDPEVFLARPILDKAALFDKLEQ